VRPKLAFLAIPVESDLCPALNLRLPMLLSVPRRGRAPQGIAYRTFKHPCQPTMQVAQLARHVRWLCATPATRPRPDRSSPDLNPHRSNCRGRSFGAEGSSSIGPLHETTRGLFKLDSLRATTANQPASEPGCCIGQDIGVAATANAFGCPRYL